MPRGPRASPSPPGTIRSITTSSRSPGVSPNPAPVRGAWVTPVLMLITVIVMVRTKLSPLWLIGGGALAGAAFL